MFRAKTRKISELSFDKCHIRWSDEILHYMILATKHNGQFDAIPASHQDHIIKDRKPHFTLRKVSVRKYSKIPILRPPLELSKSGLKDHFWTVQKVVSNQRYTGCRK